MYVQTFKAAVPNFLVAVFRVMVVAEYGVPTAAMAELSVTTCEPLAPSACSSIDTPLKFAKSSVPVPVKETDCDATPPNPMDNESVYACIAVGAKVTVTVQVPPATNGVGQLWATLNAELVTLIVGGVKETLPELVTTTDLVEVLTAAGTPPNANVEALKVIAGLAVPVPLKFSTIDVAVAEMVNAPVTGVVSVGANAKTTVQVPPAPREAPQVLVPALVTVAGNAL
jgi:hypothetical protein